MTDLDFNRNSILIRAFLLGLLIEVPLAVSLVVLVEWLRLTPHNSVLAVCLGLTQIVGITVMSLFESLELGAITYWLGVIVVQVAILTVAARSILKERHAK
jgi:hypothetical protein